LTSLNLSCNCLTPVGINAIALALHTNCTLLCINLSENKITVDDDDDKEQEFESLPSVQVTNQDADALTSMLKINTTLTKLCLRETNISMSCTQSIVLALHQNKTLQQLDLGYNYIIDDKEFVTIVNMLKINKTLKSLDLSGNYISSVGIKELACAFPYNIQITHLYLSCSMNCTQNDDAIVL
jgi:Ran GTPase-activating protein (RanGAP) involved in mRNA processing and transport